MDTKHKRIFGGYAKEDGDINACIEKNIGPQEVEYTRRPWPEGSQEGEDA